MQMIPIYLYQNTFTVILDLDATVAGVNEVMYQRDLKIQKGVKNNVNIQFKNSDQKRIPISNTATYVFSMFDALSQRLVLQKQLSVLDDGVTTSTRGLAQLTFTESDTLDLDKSYYQFSVSAVDSDNSLTPAYSNTYYDIAGTLILQDQVYPKLQPSTQIGNFLSSYNQGTQLWEYKSRAIFAYPQYNSNNALHTAALYMTGYKGKVIVLGTLDNNPNDQGNYATITTLNYTGFTGIEYINFSGIYSYVQFWYIPALGPGDLDNRYNQAYRGTFDQVLYRF
jgi:hypothetical protein